MILMYLHDCDCILILYLCLSHKTHDCSKWDETLAMGGAILLPEARHHHSPSFVPPSELTPRLLSAMRPTARPRRQTSIPYVFITLPNLPLLPPTNADPRFIFPPAFSPSSLPLGPRLAPGRPVYVPLRRLLITT